MLTDEIRALLRTSKFDPFTMHMSGGGKHYVHHPDSTWLTPNNTVLFVFENNAGQRVSVAELSRLEASEDAPVAT